MGETYGDLTITSDPRPGGCGVGRLVTARCTCGRIGEYRLRFITSGHTTSCGCKVVIHGLYHHPLYKVWMCMKERCYNLNHEAYKDYGGRGIVICSEWKDNPVAFIEWCESNGWKKGLEIDREQNEGHYCPSNCRIVTKKVNMRNRRSTVKATIGGVEKSLADWCEQFEINLDVVRSRIGRGWELNRALTNPVKSKI